MLAVINYITQKKDCQPKSLNFVCSQASYGVEDPEYAVTQLAQTTMRSELGKLTLDKVFRVTTNYCSSHDLYS